MAHRHAKAAEAMVQKGERAAIEREVSQDLVARLQHGPQRGRDGAHARAEHHGASALFQRRQTPFQQRQRGVGDAGVEVAGFLASKAARAIGHVREGIGGRGVDGRHQRALVVGGVVAVVNGAGAETGGGGAVGGAGHACLLMGRPQAGCGSDVEILGLIDGQNFAFFAS